MNPRMNKTVSSEVIWKKAFTLVARKKHSNVLICDGYEIISVRNVLDSINRLSAMRYTSICESEYAWWSSLRE